MNTPKKEVFLTFDDGPVPGVTTWVLDKLKEFDARATFFCVGENVKKHPEIYQRILDEGHRTGNHTMKHMNGWKNSNEKYFNDIEESSRIIQSELFRPPYGKIKLSQYFHLSKKYKIVMWSILTKDYDKNTAWEYCFEKVKNNSSNGSIIVFHDSLKAEKNLKPSLQASLEYLSSKGFIFSAFP